MWRRGRKSSTALWPVSRYLSQVCGVSVVLDVVVFNAVRISFAQADSAAGQGAKFCMRCLKYEELNAQRLHQKQ